MNEQYTIEELGLARSKEEHIVAVMDCILSEDVVLHKGGSTGAEDVIDNMGAEFKRRLVHLAMDSQNPTPSKLRQSLCEAVRTQATMIVNDIDKVF